MTWLSLLSLLAPFPAAAQSAFDATNNVAALKFPESITFSVDLKSDAEIKQVVLEYGVQAMTCGTVVAKAFPQFTPGKITTARWLWEMRRTGSEPPGAQIWWRWRVTTADGKETLTERQTITWLDSKYPWQTIGEKVRLHWYSGNQSFASALHDAALKALISLEQDIGFKSDAPPNIYIYANSEDLRAQFYYAASWVGGVAYGNYNIVLIGITPEQLEWGKSTVAHELTHILHRRNTFTCLGGGATWLSEGLAGYGQGGRSPSSMQGLQNAMADDSLIALRTLSSNFPEDRVKVDLSYTQSYSVVNFMIAEYGKEKFLAFLRAIQNGATVDEALRATYNFDTDGLEDAWRAKMGAKPRAAVARLTPTATPTAIPTFALVAAVQIPTRTPTLAPPTATSTLAPTATQTPAPPTPTASSQPAPIKINLDVLILGALGLLVVIVVVIVLVFRRQRRTK
jgi:hypothetical protein